MIQIPVFGDAHAAVLSVCAMLRTDDPAMLKRIKSLSKRSLIASGRHRERFSVVLLAGNAGSMSDRHLHVNVMRQSLSPKPKGIKFNATVAEVQEAVRPLEGQLANASVRGYFHVPVSDLPAERGIIWRIESKQHGIGIRQAGARLRLTGGPVDEVEWFTMQDERELRVVLDVEKELTIGEHYLTEAYDVLSAAFKVLVLGEAPNVAEEINRPRGEQDAVRR